jgi:NAD(P)-dependent dehydrogenase (short-subunit alcohol dehydrogenase family)
VRGYTSIPEKEVRKRVMTVLISAISSDIGSALAERYLKRGDHVIGTYRSPKAVHKFLGLPNCHLFYCDINNKEGITRFVKGLKKLDLKWDIFISCVGILKPIGRFFDCDFDEWSNSISINAIEQLRFLHEIYQCRQHGKIVDVVFFAGGGTNSPMVNYSAYCVSKIMLIKMCEILDAECESLNIFILGPGWVRTKIHNETLDNPQSSGENYRRTVQFLESGKAGTSYSDIYNCINWGISQGKKIASGRNFSVVYDSWRQGGRQLVEQLERDADKFKLRRFRNKD